MRKTTYLLLIALTSALYSQNIHAQTLERLKAYAVYGTKINSNSYQASDSFTYHYSGVAAHDTISSGNGFDSCYRWYTANGINYKPYSLSYSQWFADNRFQSDTVWKWDSTLHSYKYLTYDTASYDTALNRSSTFVQRRDSANTGWIDDQRLHSLYNSTGMRIYSAYEIFYSGTWDTTETINSTFNVNNTIASTTTRNFSWGRNINNRVVQVNNYQYTYDSLGRIDTIFLNIRSNDTSSWYLQNRSINHYDASGDRTVQLTQALDSSGWSNSALLTSTYDANHNMIQYIDQIADSTGNWQNNRRCQYTYDSYNMMTSYTQNTWDTSNGGSWQATYSDRMVHYYYETFNLPSGIAEITQAGQARLYPVPAADMLSLDITWNEAQPSIATIYDATGKQQSQFTLPDAATYHGYIPAYTLPAGIYTLQIKGSKGSITKQFNVLK